MPKNTPAIISEAERHLRIALSRMPDETLQAWAEETQAAASDPNTKMTNAQRAWLLDFTSNVRQAQALRGYQANLDTLLDRIAPKIVEQPAGEQQ